MNLRLLTVDDVPQAMVLLKGFHYAAKAKRWATFEDSYEHWQNYLMFCIQNSEAAAVVVEKKGTLAALVTAHVHRAFWNPNVAFASETVLWVHPEARGKGYAKALIDTIEAWSKELELKGTAFGGSRKLNFKPIKKLLLSKGYEMEEIVLIKENK